MTLSHKDNSSPCLKDLGFTKIIGVLSTKNLHKIRVYKSILAPPLRSHKNNSSLYENHCYANMWQSKVRHRLARNRLKIHANHGVGMVFVYPNTTRICDPGENDAPSKISDSNGDLVLS